MSELACTTLPRATAQAIAAASRRRYPRRSPAQRAAQGQRSRQAWATGKMAQKRPSIRADVWTAAHDTRLRALAGQLLVGEIAARLSAEFPGTPRTETAVRIRLKRLGLSPVLIHFNARTVGYLFGVDGKTITSSWIARGWLQATQQRPGVAGSSWVITAAQLEVFIRAHPEAYDWRAMPRTRWRSLAEVEWRRDPLLTVEEAAPILGLHPHTLSRHLREGRIAGLRRLEKGGAREGLWLLRRSTLRAHQVDLQAEPGFRVIPLAEAHALVAAWHRERGRAVRASRDRKAVSQ